MTVKTFYPCPTDPLIYPFLNIHSDGHLSGNIFFNVLNFLTLKIIWSSLIWVNATSKIQQQITKQVALVMNTVKTFYPCPTDPLIYPFLNTVDPDQLASGEAI